MTSIDRGYSPPTTRFRPPIEQPVSHAEVMGVDTTAVDTPMGGEYWSSMSGLPDAAMGKARGAYVKFHPGPAGLGVHDGQLRHKIQRGDTLSAITRSYNQAYHLFLDWHDVYNANKAIIGDNPSSIRASMAPIEIPGLNEKIDGEIWASSNLVPFNNQLRHQITSGESLSKISDHYNEHFGLGLTWQKLYDANKDIVGNNPRLIRTSMDPLVVPGITGPADPWPTVAKLDGKIVAERSGLEVTAGGDVKSIVTERYKLESTGARLGGTSLSDAMDAARLLSLGGDGPLAIVQAKGGEYWIADVVAEAGDATADDSWVISNDVSPTHAAVAGWSEQSGYNGMTEQRFRD